MSDHIRDTSCESIVSAQKVGEMKHSHGHNVHFLSLTHSHSHSHTLPLSHAQVSRRSTQTILLDHRAKVFGNAFDLTLQGLDLDRE
jgi:hypothetical protein